MKPTVGRIVHYVSYGTPVRADGSQAYTSECRAAIITAVHPLTGVDAAQAEVEQWDTEYRYDVDLCVLNPTGQFFNQKVWHAHAQSGKGGTWHWPEREEETNR